MAEIPRANIFLRFSCLRKELDHMLCLLSRFTMLFILTLQMASLPQSTISNGMEPSSLVTLQTDTSLAPSHSKPEHTSHAIPQGSPPLVQQRKSRIPRFMPPSVLSGKCAPTAPTPKPQSVSISMQVSNLPKKIIKTSQTETVVKTRSVTEHTVKTVSHPLHGVKSTPVIKQEVKLTPPDATSVMKPLATSTPARPTGRKVYYISLFSYFFNACL